MNLPQNTASIASIFTRLRIVLVETSRPGNIGSVARAMKTMGFSDLVLVQPRFDGALQAEEAVAFATARRISWRRPASSARWPRRWTA
jgi:tRNA/rRNA methyltransferase